MERDNLKCECGNETFAVLIVTDEKMCDSLDDCDTYAFYCTKCNKGKVVRYVSNGKREMPKI